MFMPLGRNEIHDIVQLQFKLIAKRLEKQGIDLQITEKAIDWIASVGYDPQYGARPVKRVLQNYLLNELSKKLLDGSVVKGQQITVDTESEELIFR